jgi:ssDNA-binding Zn-finger/Zn-ribbon topoisomerase 1
MVASQQSLTKNSETSRPIATASFIRPDRSTAIDNLTFAIPYNLPPNYFQESHPEHGYHWVCVSLKTGFTIEIYQAIAKRHVKILVFDNNKRRIKPWGTSLRMVGDWRRRLRRAAGEALILINQRPNCPSCNIPMIVCQRRKNKTQFFGCPTFPACTESLNIVRHDIERPATTSEWTTSEQKEETYLTIARNLPPNYYQMLDDKHGYHWFCQNQHTGFKANIYASLPDAKINITFIDKKKQQTIEAWSNEIQMVSDWPSRLRRAAGEALVLVQQRPKCHICRSEMELRKRHQDERQFFGCSKYPNCVGTISITDHDVERTKAAS